MVRNKLLVVTEDANTGALYSQQLVGMIGKLLDIEYISFMDEDLKCNPFESYLSKIKAADLLVASCNSVAVNLKKHYPKGLPKTIVASTTLNNAFLTKLVHLPQKTNALVVTNFKETALAAISLLREYGFTDLNYIPYYAGCQQSSSQLDKCSVAITTGVPYLVPEIIPEVIDIGIRVIDVSTVVEILLTLDLPVNIINDISEKYIKDLLSLNRNYKMMVDKVIELNKQLDAVVNSSEDGIILADSNLQVTFMNTTSEKMFKLGGKTSCDYNVRDLIPGVKFAFNSLGRSTETLTTIGVEKALVKQLPVVVSGKNTGLIISIKSVKQVQRLEEEVRMQSLQTGQIAKYQFGDIISDCDQMLKIIGLARSFAQTERNILITGESGTGKELFAHSIHHYSNRNKGPFIPINFSSLPESLVESELFGYEGGAFTGAKNQGKEGLFEMAHQGTLFLDEIGDASTSIQINLLRILEENKVRRLSGKKLLPVDVRVIAATNKDLKQLVLEGKFRDDLFYRLHIFHIHIPPLRERPEDVKLLLDWFMKKETDFTISAVPNSILSYLCSYHWPGNIRQLYNTALFLCTLLENKVSNFEIANKLHEYLSFMPDIETKLNYPEIPNNTLYIHGSTEDFRVILTALSENGNKRTGRRYLLNKVSMHSNTLTEAKVRKILEVLSQHGYVITGKTKQGTRITEKGLDFLSSLSTKSQHKR